MNDKYVDFSGPDESPETQTLTIADSVIKSTSDVVAVEIKEEEK